MLAVCNINANPDVPRKGPILIKSWHADIENPAILSPVMTQPILHLELLSLIKRLSIGIEAPLQVVGMNALRPTVSKLLFQRSSGEIQPRLVEVVAELIVARHPDQHRSGICNQPETLFAFPHCLFAAVTFGNVCHHTCNAQQFPLLIEVSTTAPLNPNDCIVRACDSVADVKVWLLRTEGGYRVVEPFAVVWMDLSQYLLSSNRQRVTDPQYLSRLR